MGEILKIIEVQEGAFVVESDITGRWYAVAFDQVDGEEEVTVTELGRSDDGLDELIDLFRRIKEARQENKRLGDFHLGITAQPGKPMSAEKRADTKAPSDDFTKLIQEIEEEARREGPEAVEHLRLLQAEFRLENEHLRDIRAANKRAVDGGIL